MSPARRSRFEPPTDPPPRRLVGAILTGGQGSRMGGAPKGMLPGLDGRPLASRLGDLFVSMEISYTLVGRPDDHAPLDRPRLADRWPGLGPLGGLATACAWAAGQGADAVVVLACDLPHLTRAVVERLTGAPSGVEAVFFAHPPLPPSPLPGRFAASLAPRLDAVLARAAADPDTDLSLRGFFRSTGWLALPLSPLEAPLLNDWDTPADIAADRASGSPGLPR